MHHQPMESTSATVAGTRRFTEYFPPLRHEEWKYVAFLSELRERAFAILEAPSPPVSPIASVEANHIIFTGGVPRMNIDASDQRYVTWIEGGRMPGDAFTDDEQTDNPFLRLTSDVAPGILRITVPRGEQPGRPFYLHYLPTSDHASILPVQIWWEVEDEASLTLIEISEPMGKGATWILRTAFGNIGCGGRMHHGTIQVGEGQHYEIFHAHSRVGGNGYYQHDYVGWSDIRRTRNNLHVTFAGPEAEGHMNGLFLVDGKGFIDNHTRFTHQEPHCRSHEQYHGLLRRQGVGVFNGKIYVDRAAQKTDAYQSNRNVLLDGMPTMNAKPQLEIFADDVRCSHGCTVGPLDESGVFYLTSRGITPSEARHMMAMAFGQVVAELMHPIVRQAAIQMLNAQLTTHA